MYEFVFVLVRAIHRGAELIGCMVMIFIFALLEIRSRGLHWLPAPYGAEDDLELVSLRPPPPPCWDFNYMPHIW